MSDSTNPRTRSSAIRPPNVLWICTDQQRYDTIAALGNSLISTPNIDGLVRDGVTFTQAYCQSPVCTPSRASFLTGRYPRTTRCRQNGQSIPADERLVSRLFADAGYRCGLAGKLHLASCSDGKVEERIDDGYEHFAWSHHPQPDWAENAYTQWLARRGKSWDELYSAPGSPYVKPGVPAEFHQTTWCADEAIQFIRSERDAPWFFSFNCFDPHHPFDPPAEYLSRYAPESMPLPKRRSGELQSKPLFQQLDSIWAHNSPGEFHTAEMTDDDRRQVCAAYYAMCELIDDQVGRMLSALDETGQRENTIVIFMSDHGEMLGDHGIYFKGPHFYDEAVRVPLIFSWPGQFLANRRIDGLTELIDIAPTLLDLAGLDMPQRIQGRSLRGFLDGQRASDAGRPHVFSEYYNSWTHSNAYGSMLRTKEQKIVVYHGTDDVGELYDLRNDPDEFENLWAAPAAASRKLDMMKRCFDASVLSMDPDPPRRGPF